jgi:hypothetical protein
MTSEMSNGQDLSGCMDEVEIEFQGKIYLVESGLIYLNDCVVGEVNQDGLTFDLDEEEEEETSDEEEGVPSIQFQIKQNCSHEEIIINDNKYILVGNTMIIQGTNIVGFMDEGIPTLF